MSLGPTVLNDEKLSSETLQRDIRQPLQTGVNSQLAGLVVKRCRYFPSLENFLYELKRIVQGSAAERARATIQTIFKYSRKLGSTYPCIISRGRNTPKISLHRRQGDEDHHQAYRFCRAARNMADPIPSQPSMLRLVLQLCEIKEPSKTLRSGPASSSSNISCCAERHFSVIFIL